MISLKEGKYLVKLARKSILNYFEEGTPVYVTDAPWELMEKSGAFVTLHSHPSHDLRGCIGLPLPHKPLAQAVAEMACAAAFEDPRFQHMRKKEEMDEVVVEVSVMTVPKAIEGPKEQLPKKIKIGRDGLIIEYGGYGGLLLPQVPVEQGWGVEEYLQNICYKAGLTRETWKQPDAVIKTFQAQVFLEKEPNGEVEEKELGDEEWQS